MKNLLILILLFSVFACHRQVKEPPITYAWTKEDSGQQQLLKDQYDCNQQAQTMYTMQTLTFGALLPLIGYKKNFNDCMAARGYVFKPVSPPSP